MDARTESALVVLFTSELFTVPGFLDRCELQFGHAGDLVDRVIDLHTVARAFREHYAARPFEECLRVIAFLSPLLSGPNNLCRIADHLHNQKENDPGAVQVRDYLLNGEVVTSLRRLFGEMLAVREGQPSLQVDFVLRISEIFSEKHGLEDFPNYPQHP